VLSVRRPSRRVRQPPFHSNSPFMEENRNHSERGRSQGTGWRRLEENETRRLRISIPWPRMLLRSCDYRTDRGHFGWRNVPT
jgi:hypothetical protein